MPFPWLFPVNWRMFPLCRWCTCCWKKVSFQGPRLMLQWHHSAHSQIRWGSVSLRRSQRQNLQIPKITALSLQVRSHRTIVLTPEASCSFIVFSSLLKLVMEWVRIYTKPLHLMQSLAFCTVVFLFRTSFHIVVTLTVPSHYFLLFLSFTSLRCQGCSKVE